MATNQQRRGFGGCGAHLYLGQLVAFALKTKVVPRLKTAQYGNLLVQKVFVYISTKSTIVK